MHLTAEIFLTKLFKWLKKLHKPFFGIFLCLLLIYNYIHWNETCLKTLGIWKCFLWNCWFVTIELFENFNALGRSCIKIRHQIANLQINFPQPRKQYACEMCAKLTRSLYVFKQCCISQTSTFRWCKKFLAYGINWRGKWGEMGEILWGELDTVFGNRCSKHACNIARVLFYCNTFLFS